MDAGPDALRTSAVEYEPPLGAVPGGDADLGPISPELALVDPELAERARRLLPEPRERPQPRRTVPAPPPPVPEREEVPPAPDVSEAPDRPRRRWPQTVVLAAVIFAGGAASGSFLGNEDAGSPGTTLEVGAVAPVTQARPTKTATVKRAALRPPTASKKRHRQRAASHPRKRKRPARRVAWASNVLGVEAWTDRPGVALVWQRPADSGHVVVLRAPEKRGPSVVVYRGRATSYRDASPRRCTAYRYTIVNYDRRGHRSTGVPTSVVTQGCT